MLPRQRIEWIPAEYGQQADCKQCGLYCTVTRPAEAKQKHRQIDSGATACYMCRWANVALHNPKYKGLSFAEFIRRVTHIEAMQKGGR